ncbi:MAG TPA: cation diffusion facilitator family transporter [Planctomycetaceae bacterium]|jgi:cobalt-zinc-cadmium efflux system protein|nr:cation diffusion facilitator family transporter [Planctomycetaceae bacterium]
MAHDVSSHACSHDHHPDAHHHHSFAGTDTGKMRWALILTVAFLLCEAVAAWFADSLALLSDAGHNFADAAAVGFSWYALWIAQKPAHTGMTYGYHRVGILAALFNAVSLVVIALLIFWEAGERLRNPAAVDGWLMIGVSLAAVALNVTISVWLHAGAKHDLNVRSAYLHMAGDAVSALGVTLAGVVVVFGGPPLADAIASLVIGALILWSSWGVLKESVNVLLEGTPFGLDMAAVETAIAAVPGVLNVHDLHVWTVGSGVIACSCHVLVAEQTVSEGQQILKSVVDELGHHFGISHTTVQIEVEGHEADEMYCTMQKRAGGLHVHRHRH